jgi:hypothetical protein
MTPEFTVLLVAELTPGGEGVSSDTQVTDTPDANIPVYLPKSKRTVKVGRKFKEILDTHQSKPSMLVSAHFSPFYKTGNSQTAYELRWWCERTPVADPEKHDRLMKSAMGFIQKYLRSKGVFAYGSVEVEAVDGLHGTFSQGGRN